MSKVILRPRGRAGAPALRRVFSPALFAACAAVLLGAGGVYAQQLLVAQAPQTPAAPSLARQIRNVNEQMEMTVNTSRILTIGQKIPQYQVNNPEVLELVPLSPTEIQISAKAAGVTQVNLWGEDKRVYTVNVIVFGDAEELKMVLKTQFRKASLKVLPVGTNVLISGYVDRPGDVETIIRIAEEFYPKVINNITVGGVQQVLLHVKVYEVSRTKLRRLGFDFAKFNGSDFVVSSISGLITAATSGGVTTSGTETMAFGVVDGSSSFFGVLEALRQDNLLKILAEPTLITVSGRPAFFNVGGEIPIPVPQSLGTISIEWKKYGTQVDFVPIVLGEGRIHLEVRPRVSELDNTRSLTLASTTIPGIRERVVDTAVELQAGQTLALAGLVQTRIEAENRGIPWISEVPYFGVPFRTVEETMNEVELLILVTPELVEAMDASEVPPCGPGTRTTSPCDWELFMKGWIEVPKCCPPGGVPLGGPLPQGMPHKALLPQEGMILEGPGSIEPPPAPMPTPAESSRNMPQDRQKSAPPVMQTSAQTSLNVPQNRHRLSQPAPVAGVFSSGQQSTVPEFIGPVGYDLVK